MAKIGFIGMGNMGYAMLKGVLKTFDSSEIVFSDANEERMEKISRETKVEYALSNAECANSAKYIILAVKPQFYDVVLKNIVNIVKPDNVIISIAPGITIDRLKRTLGQEIRIVRAMPNTPALLGEGMTGVTYESRDFTFEEKDTIEKIFNSIGKMKVVDESLMSAVVCASGSSPAYVYMFIEALADGAVRCGMSRKDAYEFVAQTVLGSAKMVLETKEHPGVLKDMVCSPAGTTIEAVAALEKCGFRDSLLEATKACYNKAENINSKK
ncbi:MAG: pyrroline-5-carboxylate reductase [Eubacterium sp.]